MVSDVRAVVIGARCLITERTGTVNETKTIPQILESIAEAICNEYCRYPLEWDEEKDGELADSEVCANCPLNRLT